MAGMDASLVHIHPVELQDSWPIVLPGLLKVQKHSASKWIPEDVYSAIKTGSSTLHLAYVNGDYTGFVILTPSLGFDGKVLHLWCAYNATKHDVLKTFLPELERMARSIGAKRMTFWSPRKWERKISQYGYVPSQTEFVKELI